MTLPQQGFRFVLRTNEQGRLDSKWVHPAELRPGDLDCTDMDDDTFERAYHSWSTRNQCDGCARGLSVTGGLHRGPGSWDLQACTADRYSKIEESGRRAMQSLRPQMEKEREALFAEVNARIRGSGEQA